MWNTVAGATKHVARKFFAASASSSSSSSNVKRASLRDLLKTEMRVQSKELDSATTGGIATDDAPPSTPTGDESDELLATWLVHFAPDVVLSDETTARFQSETGLTLGNYMPHHTYIVIATDSQIRRAREILADDFCDHISEYPVQAKVTTRSLAALMDRSEREISDANLPPFKDFRLNLQLQPLPSGEKRSLEQLEELAGLVQRFMQHHSLHAMEVRALPSFSNNLLMLLPLSTTTSSSTPSKDVPAVEVRRILQELSALVEVAFLELRLAHTLHNQYAQFLTQSGNPTPTGGPQNDGRPIWARGLRGEGQIVGCADSGCDWDHCYFNGPGSTPPGRTVNPSARKVIAYYDFADTTDDANGHGTHVTGSIVGNPGTTSSDAGILSHSGEAPEAKLYFQDIGAQSGGLSGLDNVGDLGEGLFQRAFDAGARIHSNSWGSADNSYTTSAQSIDQFIFQTGGKSDRHMLILYAAGNDGLKEGSVSGTVGSPATAKNIISVGASQTTNQGWIDSTDYIDYEEKRLDAAEQLGQDVSTFDCCTYTQNPKVPAYCCQAYIKQQIQNSPTEHYEGDMAGFSSRGPTLDGRVKPELVAPGENIVSARSDGGIKGANQCSSSMTGLLSLAGTSMATPTLAGNAALVRQYLAEGWYPGGVKGSSTTYTDPSAALISAMLINGAQSLTGTIDRDNDGKVQQPLTNGIYPLSVFQGFGRVTLDRSLWFQGETRYRQWVEDQRTPIATGEDQDYCLTTTAATAIKVTLVWHDAPADIGAGVVAVNNLDVYFGTSADTAKAGNFVERRDTLNNAESGSVDVAKAGQTVYIKIRAITVAKPQQHYALAVSGQFDPATVKVGSAACNTATNFVISSDRFSEATDSDHFPLGPVVGGVVGGVGGLAILGAIARYCYMQYCGK